VSRRRRNERGAVAVEAGLLMPLLALVLFGIIEMSLLMRDTVAVTSSVRTGSRIAATAPGAGPGTPATTPALTQAAADAIKRAGSAMPADSIDWILVYQANAAGYPMPAGNTATLACSTNCVKYVWDAATDKFRYDTGSWASASINACVNDANRMAVGVAMRAHHNWITGLFGNGVNMTERSVMQFEPLPNDLCAAGAHQ
jgi:Flp pilus assembly protein TadG